MAFTAGLHVACAFAGSKGFAKSEIDVIRPPIWAQTFTAAGTTTDVAPSFNDQAGFPLFQVSAAVDAFIAFGPDPTATGATAKRFFIKAGETREYAVNAKDKLAWVAA